jgi:hypothetical protein
LATDSFGGDLGLACSLLIKAIINMLLISIQPFAFRKIFVLVAALLGLSSAACFADSLFMSLHPTTVNKPMARASQVTLSATAPMFAAKDPFFHDRQNDGVITEDSTPIDLPMDYPRRYLKIRSSLAVWDHTPSRSTKTDESWSGPFWVSF